VYSTSSAVHTHRMGTEVSESTSHPRPHEEPRLQWKD